MDKQIQRFDLPLVSVIMPVRNESNYIQRSLKAVLAQDYPAERMEIIIADGMSTDGTRKEVQKFLSQHSNISLIDNPGKIVPKALNLATIKSRGEILIRVDGHCEIAPDYVRRCVEHIQNDDVDGVGGPINTVGETWVAMAIAAAMSSPFGVGGSAFRTRNDETLLVDTVPFPAYRRAVIEHAGPYDTELVRNQDDEYNYRLRKLGYKIMLAADVRSKYYSRNSLRALSRQYFQYGFWKVRVLQKHFRQMRPRQFVPPVFVASVLGSGLWALFEPSGLALMVLILGSYLVANLASTSWVAFRKGWILLPLLPLVFVILHFSYGLGFLIGLVIFTSRWGDK